jgi:hypothetical protein
MARSGGIGDSDAEGAAGMGAGIDGAGFIASVDWDGVMDIGPG